jgi:hypothetical protein
MSNIGPYPPELLHVILYLHTDLRFKFIFVIESNSFPILMLLIDIVPSLGKVSFGSLVPLLRPCITHK